MNDENNNNNDLNLSNLYGVTTSENVKQSSEELQKEIEQNIETPPPVKEEPKKESLPKKEKPNKNNNSSTSAVPLLIILIIVIVVGYNFIIKNDDTSLKTEKNDDEEKYEVINNVPKTEEPTDPESINKKAMADLFKKYAKKVDDYIQKGKYYCVVGELLRPTRFVIEIDTSSGDSTAQQNGRLIQEDSVKSPWDNKDIKGYIIVENQLMENNKYHVFLSDGYYGLAAETERKKINQESIVPNISYPIPSEDNTKCHLGEEPVE